MEEMTAVQNLDTTPIEEPEVDSQATEIEEPSETPNTEEKPSEEASNDTAEQPENADEFVLRYNHEDLSVTKEEAKRLAQIGMHYDKLGKSYGEDVKSVMADLEYFAVLQNKSIKEVVTEMVNGIENSYRQELIEELGEGHPLIEEMMELRKSKNMKAYEDYKGQKSIKEQQAAAEAEQAVTTKLATQFEEISKSYPEYKTMADVPDVVYKQALKSGDLEKELLRYQLAQEKVIKETTQNEEKNKKENIGSISTGGKVEDSAISEMLKGVWG